MAENARTYNVAAIRELLTQAFTDRELRRLCQDHPAFSPILTRFSHNHALDDMVDVLIDYCQTRFLWKELLDAVARQNPQQYARFEPELWHAAPPAHPAPTTTEQRTAQGPGSTTSGRIDVFLSYDSENQSFVEAVARQLHTDGRVSFWFAPWHGIPGVPLQEQMEDALLAAEACAVFIGGSGETQGWHDEQMRLAIQARVEDEPGYRVLPVLVPSATRPAKRDLAPFLRRYEMVEFASMHDQAAFRRLLAGVMGVPPVELEYRGVNIK